MHKPLGGVKRVSTICATAWRKKLSALFGIICVLLTMFLGVKMAIAIAPPAGTSVGVVAFAEYIPDTQITSKRVNSNEVVFTIAAVEAFTLSSDARVPAQPNAHVTIPYLLSNTGNVQSSYNLLLANNGAGCAADGFDVAQLKIFQDKNNNGYVDAADTEIIGALSVAAGQSISLLVTGDTPNLTGVEACLALTATTVLQAQSTTANTTVVVGNGAALNISKTASYSGYLIPGSNNTIDYTIRVQNNGTANATQAATNGAVVPTAIRINGAPTSVLLVRDEIPAGSEYVPASLVASHTEALKLWRMSTDPAFEYRIETLASPALPTAAEVAVAMQAPYVMTPGGAFEMTFQTKLAATAGNNGRSMTTNQAYVHYRDGLSDSAVRSNPVILPLTLERIGIALAAGKPVAQYDANGVLDGTAIVRMTAKVRSYSLSTLQDLQINHLLEGNTATALGAWTAATVPAAGQYSLIPGSLRLLGTTSSATVAAINPGYDGRAANQGLLAAGARLPAGAELTVEYDVRINFISRPAQITTQAQALASYSAGGALDISDLSHDGLDPAPDTFNPQNYASVTPIVASPLIAISKSVTNITRLSSSQFDISYKIAVANNGTNPATRVRLIDNLECAMSTAGVNSWSLTSAPVASFGRLQVSPLYTGKEACTTPVDATTNVPLAATLSLTDGTLDLAPGQSEEVSFTVRVNVTPGRTTINNAAWAVTLDAGAAIVVATSTSINTLLSDPQGIVYDNVSRLPVAGAVVTLTRTAACSVGASAAITAADLSSPGPFTIAGNSVSMTTGADGGYQFIWKNPPVNSLCTYNLTVTPPASHQISTFPQFLPQAAPFTSCGNVVPNATIPVGAEPTTWHNSFDSGFTAGGVACEVLNNHIPLDPKLSGLLALTKEGSKKIAEIGDYVDFKLTLSNRIGVPLSGIRFEDVLPPGFAYVNGSARLAGVAVADPVGGAGPALSFDFPVQTLANDASIALQYRVRIGISAVNNKDALNRAWVVSGLQQSNQATHSVRVVGGPFSDEAYAFGKVHLDCNGNGIQDGDDEWGVPGVRLLLETGANVITDAEGRWSLYGLRPISHVIKLDPSTLPKEAKLGYTNNRYSRDERSHFLDLKKGELTKSNFPISTCTDIVKEQVKARIDELAKNPYAELDAAVNTRLATTPAPLLGSNPNGPASSLGESAMPAHQAMGGALIDLSGKLSASNPSGAAVSPLAPIINAPSLPGAQQPGASRAGGADMLGPLAAPGVIDLEKIMPNMDNSLGFIDFKDRDTILSNVVNVRVKGPFGTNLRLSVNTVEIADRRVGKKASLESKRLAAWEYIGIELKPGVNELKVDSIDSLGINRGTKTIYVVAPDTLSVMSFVLPEKPLADPLSPIEVIVKLTDRQGLPITARTQVTLEADRGRWLAQDLNPNESGTQVFIEDGQAKFMLQPPTDPGATRLRASSNLLVQESVVHYLPQKRPLTGIGILEGIIDLSRRGKLTLGQTAGGGAFEDELREHSTQKDDKRSAARLGFYFKGTIKGEYLLSTAYDSDKQKNDRLFRDIKPDEYYPVYGDGSVRGYDAQSTSKLYVRIDKNRSYLLYGDFTSASSEEVRQLSQLNRTLTGAKHKYETEQLRITSFASRDSSKQQIEEIRASGVSFYFLKGLGDIISGTDKVEILVRSSAQPQIILSAKTLARNVDYTFEPLTRRLLLVNPVASVNADFNPQSIRVTYEVDTGGTQYNVAGVDAQFKVGDRVQAGVVVGRDDNPENRRDLNAVTGLARLGKSTVVAAEAVQTESDLKGKGSGGRIELRLDDGTLKIHSQVKRQDKNFDNPGAGSTAGRTEGTFIAELKLSTELRLRSEVTYSKDDAIAGGSAGGVRSNAAVALQKKFNPNLVGEVGVRHGNTSGTSAGGFDYGRVLGSGTSATAGNAASTSVTDTNTTAVNGRLTARLPSIPRLEVFGEAEQSVDAKNKHSAAVGGTYGITDKTRLYGRHEFISDTTNDATLSNGSTRNTTVIGAESAYMEGGRVYDEARFSAVGVQNATGVRNSIKVNERLSVNGSAEHVSAQGATASSSAIALGGQYTDGPWRGNGAVELRKQGDTDAGLLSLGTAYKLDQDWTALGRSITTLNNGGSAGSHLISRQQIGLAWRPADTDIINTLMRYEYRYESIKNADATATTSLFNTSGAALPGDYNTHIVTGIGNYNPTRELTLTGRYAAKYTDLQDLLGANTYWAQLTHARIIYDLNEDWDVGVQGGVMWDKSGSTQNTAGIEAGYQVARNLWFSTGYNFIGLSEPDLTGADYTSEGLYLRLRYKFDEYTFGKEEVKHEPPPPPPIPAPLPVLPPEEPPVVLEPEEVLVVPVPPKPAKKRPPTPPKKAVVAPPRVIREVKQPAPEPEGLFFFPPIPVRLLPKWAKKMGRVRGGGKNGWTWRQPTARNTCRLCRGTGIFPLTKQVEVLASCPKCGTKANPLRLAKKTGAL